MNEIYQIIKQNDGSPKQKLNVIIMCAGNQSRWNNYLNIPKHLVRVIGERLLDRTIRLIKTYLNEWELNINILSRQKEGYQIPDTNLILKHYLSEREIPSATITSFPHLNDDEYNLVIFGDTFFTETGFQKIPNFLKKSFNDNKSTTGIIYIGREGPNLLTGCRYGDLFGFILLPQSKGLLMRTADKVEQFYKKGIIQRFSSWEIYRCLHHLPLKIQSVTKDFLEINDWTEDFDYPKDYINWINKRKEALKPF